MASHIITKPLAFLLMLGIAVVATDLDACYGTCTSTDRDHSMNCLMRWWVEAGCSPNGSSAPFHAGKIILDMY